jgi:thiol-activated cytolysin
VVGILFVALSTNGCDGDAQESASSATSREVDAGVHDDAGPADDDSDAARADEEASDDDSRDDDGSGDDATDAGANGEASDDDSGGNDGSDDDAADAGADETNPTAAESFDEVITGGGDIAPFPQSRRVIESGETEVADEDYEREAGGGVVRERFVCTRRTVSVEDGSGTFPLFDTAADVIYPGSLLQGKSLSNATPDPIVVARAGGTISYNLNNGNLLSSFEVDEVSKSSIQNGMNSIIANAGEVVPANFQLDILQIESESQLALELGIDVDTFTTKVSADMSFSQEKQFNRTLVKLTQSYYTMSFDLPTSLEAIFAPSVTARQLGMYVGPDNPATFVSSVTYGRIFYMLVESTSSRQEMEAKLNVAYGAFGNSVEGDLGVSAMQELNDLKVKVIAYGGDAAGTFRLAGETSIANIANKLAESTDVRAGLPLSYVVRSVERPDQIVGTHLATEYDVVDCELKGVLPPGLYSDLVDLFDDGIGAMAHLVDSDVLVFSKAGDRYAWFNGNSASVLSDGDRRIFDITDPAAPLGALSMESVGAAVNFADADADRLYVFSGDGFSFQIAPLSAYTANQLPTGTIATPGDVQLVNQSFGDSGGFVLGSEGLGAALPAGVSTMAFFGSIGDRYQLYNSQDAGTWSDDWPSTDWYGGDPSQDGTKLFDKVGAATAFTIGGSSARMLFVSEAGNELLEWYSSAEPGQDRFEGPWVLD